MVIQSLHCFFTPGSLKGPWLQIIKDESVSRIKFLATNSSGARYAVKVLPTLSQDPASIEWQDFQVQNTFLVLLDRNQAVRCSV